MARQADKPMAWLRTAVPKCFIGASVIPITPAGCPMPECINLRVNAMNRVGQCVNCGLHTRARSAAGRVSQRSRLESSDRNERK